MSTHEACKAVISLDSVAIFYQTIRDENTLANFVAQLECRKEEVLAAKLIELSGNMLSLKGPKTITKASRPRGKKETEDEKNANARDEAKSAVYKTEMLMTKHSLQKTTN